MIAFGGHDALQEAELSTGGTGSVIGLGGHNTVGESVGEWMMDAMQRYGTGVTHTLF